MKTKTLKAPAAGPIGSVWVVTWVGLAACSAPSASTDEALDDEAAATRIAEALIAACPDAALDDEAARDRCAGALGSSSVMRELSADKVFWGGQKVDGLNDYTMANRTLFDPLAWRRMYLSTYIFEKPYEIVREGDVVIARVAIRFRNLMDPGAFPYPFWHSADKWASYQTARQALFFVQGGKLVGGLRSAARDPGRPLRDMAWDGRWRWSGPKGEEPHVSLFTYLFARDNPHVGALEKSFRDLESEMRTETCVGCHSPDNSQKTNPLFLLLYPNQALVARHEVVNMLGQNLMPPPTGAGSGGVADPAARVALLEMASTFAAAGDRALAFEAGRR